MKNTHRLMRTTGWLVALLFCVASVHAKAPKFPAPKDARVTVVGSDMRVNGIDTQIREFKTRDGIGKVIDFYRDEWGRDQGDDGGYTINEISRPWTVISHIEDGYLMTVQAQPTNDDGTWGYLSMSRLPVNVRSPKLGKDFPKMRGSETFNEVVSKDPGQTGRTMLLGNKFDLQTNVAFYRNYYGSQGWDVDMDQSMGSVMHVLALRKGRKRVNLVIQAVTKDGTRIVVNEVKHDIL